MTSADIRHRNMPTMHMGDERHHGRIKFSGNAVIQFLKSNLLIILVTNFWLIMTLAFYFAGNIKGPHQWQDFLHFDIEKDLVMLLNSILNALYDVFRNVFYPFE